MVHQYNYPTTILYGAGATSELARRLAAERRGPLLLCTDPGLVKAGLADRVEKALTSAGLGVVTHAEIHPNPIEDDVTSGAIRYNEAGCRGIVALGGGSPMDAAKVIGVLASNSGSLDDYDATRGGDGRIQKPLPPVYAIPTTAGTGSEVGRSAVVVSRTTRRKTIVFHPTLIPRVAVLDPELCVGLPPHITAATGMDAFTHGLEAYFSVGHHPMADAIALGCMEMVIEHLPRAVRDGKDLEARGNMLLAATMGATAFQKGLGMVHSLAHPLSTHYGMHHGLANALLLPGVLAWQLASKRGSFTDDLLARYRRVARLFPESESAGPDDLPGAVRAFTRRIGITKTLTEAGARLEDLASLTDEAFDDPCHRENPIAMTKRDIEACYRYCFAA